MVETPMPSNVQEGIDPPDALPANAEDRKAAQAMASLDAKDDEVTAQPKKEADLKALNDAMKNLEVGPEVKKPQAVKKKEEPAKPLVKVDQADVTLLVRCEWRTADGNTCADQDQADQLDMSKMKATELLRAHDADAVKAMTAWVTAAV